MATNGAKATCGILGSGICLTDANLSHDLFIFYNRISNQNTFPNAGLAMGLTGARTYSLVGGNAPNWTGGLVNIVIDF
jgi:hypothetical protein